MRMFCTYAGCVQLGTSSEIVVAEWGNEPSVLFQDSSINTIICLPEEENTMVSTQPTGWMSYLLHSIEAPRAAELFSDSGIYMYVGNVDVCELAGLYFLTHVHMCVYIQVNWLSCA